MKNKAVSIIIPTYNEEKYIANCLDSLMHNAINKSNIEIIIVDGNSKDNTCAIVENYIKNNNNIKLISNPQRIVPIAMNLGINVAKGDYVIRLDAHSSYASDYISYLISNALKYESDNIGCVCKTDVLYKNKKSIAIKKVLSNKFGVGASQFRVGINEAVETDTVPFGCFKRDVFEKYGYYNEKLIRNQDIELNKRIVNNGGKIVLLPESKVSYFARETFGALAKNNYSNGKWNIYTVWLTSNFSSLSVRHFIPLMFVLALLFPIFMVPIIGVISLVFTLLILLVYLFFITIISFKMKEETSVFLLIKSFLVLHISYGIGSLVGLLTFWKQ